MQINRRTFFKFAGLSGAVALTGKSDSMASGKVIAEDPYGCLIDISRCIGCRKCEEACNQANELPAPSRSFKDKTVLNTYRRPSDSAYTVVNKYNAGKRDNKNNDLFSFVKLQCMHCDDAACVSACITGAMEKKENGTVFYNVDKCIGCRYCMVACPFEIPAYEYDNPITPKVMKCSFCYERVEKENKKPACATVCPVEAITFGKKKELLKIAENRIKNNPALYIDKIYGKDEAGGTSWLYISDVPFEKVGLPAVPKRKMPELPEKIQHSLFSYLWSPALLFGVLSGVLALSNRKTRKNHRKGEDNETL